MLYSQLISCSVLAGLATATPAYLAARQTGCPSVTCVDAMAQCNGNYVRYGGCYDQCQGSFADFYSAPPCSSTTTSQDLPPPKTEVDTPTSSPLVALASSSPATTTSLATSALSTTLSTITTSAENRIISKPPRPSKIKTLAERDASTTANTAPSPAVTKAELQPAAPTASCTRGTTVCVDALNSCGVRYGGCYDQCAGNFAALFPPPPCATTPASTAMITTMATMARSKPTRPAKETPYTTGTSERRDRGQRESGGPE